MHFVEPPVQSSSLNLAPLLDVVLLLLIFFVATTVFLPEQLPIDLAVAETGSPAEVEALHVTVDPNGDVFIESQRRTESELVEMLREAAGRQRALEVRADRESRHEALVRLLDLAQQNQLTQVGIIVDSDRSESQADLNAPSRTAVPDREK